MDIQMKKQRKIKRGRPTDMDYSIMHQRDPVSYEKRRLKLSEKREKSSSETQDFNPIEEYIERRLNNESTSDLLCYLSMADLVEVDRYVQSELAERTGKSRANFLTNNVSWYSGRKGSAGYEHKKAFYDYKKGKLPLENLIGKQLAKREEGRALRRAGAEEDAKIQGKSLRKQSKPTNYKSLGIRQRGKDVKGKIY